MTNNFTIEPINDAWPVLPPLTIALLVKSGAYAVIQAEIRFAGRDRRRVKREKRKAWDKARRAKGTA